MKNEFSFKIIKKDTKTTARAGIITTAHGKILTPAFSPVATRASVKTLDIRDIKEAKSQLVLSNTYHLYLRPGTKIIKKFGGFAPYMGWDGPTITDSGGYQVSFLWDKVKDEEETFDAKVIKIDDNGALFASYIDGSKHLLTPEKSMEIQKDLGADIIMAFDQPLSKEITPKKAKEAFMRTLKWEERSLNHWKKLKSTQALYGIVQGGTNKRLRRESLNFILNLGFPGIAMGGETIGADPKISADSLETVIDLLPDDKPLHALGLGGGPEGIFEAVERGVDTFDNTSITRMARTGLLFISPEDGGNIKNKYRKDIKNTKLKDSKKPFSKNCGCKMCQNYSASYIHHLFKSKEITGLRLATIHNVYFVNDLMEKIRASILNSDFSNFKKHWLG